MSVAVLRLVEQARDGKGLRNSGSRPSSQQRPVFVGAPNAGKGALKGAELQENRMKSLAQPRKSSSTGKSRHHRGPEVDAWLSNLHSQTLPDPRTKFILCS